MIISLGPVDRPRLAATAALVFRPRRATCWRPIRRLLRGGLPFSLRLPEGCGMVSVALTLARADLDCRRRSASPAFTGHPRSMQLGLSSGDCQRSSFPSTLLIVNVPAEIRRPDATSLQEVGRGLVPKGRFELPRAMPTT